MNRLAKLGIFLLIFLTFLSAGFVSDTVEVGHFFSSVHMFEYAFNHSFQFGVDIIDNVGPYGYLHYPYIYAGGAFWSKTLWFALICSVYAYYTISLTERIHSWPEKSLFLFAVIFLLPGYPFVLFEVIPRLAILFSAIYFLTESKETINWRTNLHIIINGLFYAFLTLEKASNVYYLALLIFILSAYWLSRNLWRNSLSLVGTYLFGLAIFWFAAGQHQLSGLLDYFASMSLFINAYQETLVTEISTRDFQYALFYCGAAAILILFRLGVSFFCFQPKKYLPVEIFRATLVAALFFLTWKHGMLRGSSSYCTFLYTVPILFGYLCLYPIAANSAVSEKSFLNRFSSRTLLILRSSLFASLLLVIWSNIVPYEHENGHKTEIFKEFQARFYALVHYQPARNLEMLDAKLEMLKQENALPPSLKQAMQSRRVDEFGSTPEIIFLNDLDYRPRPIPITFIASNAALNEKNGRYYQNVMTAPDFVLLEDFGLRVADSSAYLSLLFNYQAVNTFKNWLVLEKRASTWQNLELQQRQESQAHFDEWISLTVLPKSFLWVEIDAEPSFLGKMKHFFYKPDLVRLEIMLDDGTTQSLLVSLAQLRSGFLLNPIIQTKKEVLMLAGSPWHLANAFRITLDAPEKSRLFQQEFKVKFSVVAGSSSADAPRKPIDFPRADSLINLVAKSFPVDTTKFPIDLLSGEKREDFIVTGMSGVESNSKESWRWATGASTRIKFYVDPALPEAARRYLLKFAFKNGASIPEQAVTIRLNGMDIYHFSAKDIDKHQQFYTDVALAANKGINTLEFVYHDWNHGGKDYSPDSRQLAIVVMRLSLEAYPAQMKFPKASSLIKLSTLDAPAAAPKMLVVATKLPIDLFANEVRDDIEVTGLSGLENNDKESWRWATGPVTRIKFHVDPASPDQARQLLLKFAFKNGVPIPGQTVTIRLNGKDVRRFSSKEIAMHELADADVILAAKKGGNVLEIVYQDWNHGKKNYGSNDPRKLAVVVMRLSLQQANK